MWRITALREENVPANRVGERIDRARRSQSSCIRVHPHVAEVMAEAWLEQITGGSVQRLSWTEVADEVIRDRFASSLGFISGSELDQFFVLRLAVGAGAPPVNIRHKISV